MAVIEERGIIASGLSTIVTGKLLVLATCPGAGSVNCLLVGRFTTE